MNRAPGGKEHPRDLTHQGGAQVFTRRSRRAPASCRRAAVPVLNHRWRRTGTGLSRPRRCWPSEGCDRVWGARWPRHSRREVGEPGNEPRTPCHQETRADGGVRGPRSRARAGARQPPPPALFTAAAVRRSNCVSKPFPPGVNRSHHKGQKRRKEKGKRDPFTLKLHRSRSSPSRLTSICS